MDDFLDFISGAIVCTIVAIAISFLLLWVGLECIERPPIAWSIGAVVGIWAFYRFYKQLKRK